VVAVRPLIAALALAFAPASAHTDALIDVSGGVTALSPRLEVRVTLTNRGDQPAGPIEVQGELFEERQTARLAGTLGPGASGDVSLAFFASLTRPGRHPLTLRLEYTVAGPPDGAGNPPTTSQPAWLLLAFGVSPDDAVRVEASPLELDVRGSLVARLASLDGAPHRVRLRAHTGSGLRPDAGAIDVAVEASGAATAAIPIVRTGAPRGSRQPLLLVAETLDGPVARASVAAVTVEVAPDPSLLPVVRGPALAAGIALLLVALGYELRGRQRLPTPRA
jgi:hypothetical protein